MEETNTPQTIPEEPQGTEETDWKAESRKWEARAKKNSAAAEELEKLKARAEKAEARIAELEAEALRKATAQRLAAEKRVPIDHGSLRGDLRIAAAGSRGTGCIDLPHRARPIGEAHQR